MTYCVAMSLDAGMIFASDSRTNAGVDHVARFSKMRVWKKDGERMMVTMSSGNLSITQNALSMLEQRIREDEDGKHICSAPSMFDVARMLGDALREVKSRDGAYLMQNNIDSSANFLLGGQIRGEPQRLFHVYTEGNFIEAMADTPYFQIGETKYGKPIIDRVVHRGTSLTDAIKCVLVSFDSTMRSNISVGLPIDLLVYEHAAMRVKLQRRIDESDPYFQMVHKEWGEGLRRVFGQLPDPQWA
ncbi:MAG TPA: proteasome-type protease [Casimicrobiaceae bacterium]|nr:proteasome-type protease [Casimicrobiaceae bacterium]